MLGLNDFLKGSSISRVLRSFNKLTSLIRSALTTGLVPRRQLWELYWCPRSCAGLSSRSLPTSTLLSLIGSRTLCQQIVQLESTTTASSPPAITSPLLLPSSTPTVSRVTRTSGPADHDGLGHRAQVFPVACNQLRWTAALGWCQGGRWETPVTSGLLQRTLVRTTPLSKLLTHKLMEDKAHYTLNFKCPVHYFFL